MPAHALPIRAFQWDLARQVERLDWLLKQLPRYAEWGYQELYLHLEDAVEFPSLPAVARKDAYTYRQMEKLVTHATTAGIKVVPIVNLLGHTQYLIKVLELRDLNELRHADGSPHETGQICPLHPRTLEIAETLLRDMAPFCTAGKVHVGLDESFHLGKHPLSQREVRRTGLAAHFAGHVNRLRELTRRMNLRMGMWADMLYFLPDAIPLLPQDLIAYDWYYYPFKRLPRVELFNYAEFDLATPLMKRGIEYWGCPMNGAFRYEPLPHFGDRISNAISWWNRCKKIGAAGFLMTSWEPNRLAMETTTLVDAAMAELWQNHRITNRADMLATGIRKVFRTQSARNIAKKLLVADRHAFTGYARWEINKAWALASGPKTIAPLRNTLTYFNRLQRETSNWPACLAASIAYRRYLAARDVFVRESQTEILALRRDSIRGFSLTNKLTRQLNAAKQFEQDWRNGHAAALKMWKLTRSPNSAAPNLQLLAADRAQLKTWQQWLKARIKTPGNIVSANPLLSEWLLTYSVWNCAPAVQKVMVDQWINGEWRSIKSCHTIEFLSRGAAPRSTIQYHHSAPLNWNGTDTLKIRVRVGGVGTVKLSNLRITNGIHTHQVTPQNRWLTFGTPPSRGWPKLNAETVREFIVVTNTKS